MSGPDRGRRRLLAAAVLAVAVRPAYATPERMAQAVRDYTGGALPVPGKVRFEIAQLVENGNTVPVTVAVDAVPAGVHVTGIALFNEANPEPDIVRFTLGPRAGKPEVSTRIRLATSQRLLAVARLSDGSHWQAAADVVVTIAACVEGTG